MSLPTVDCHSDLVPRLPVNFPAEHQSFQTAPQPLLQNNLSCSWRGVSFPNGFDERAFSMQPNNSLAPPGVGFSPTDAGVSSVADHSRGCMEMHQISEQLPHLAQGTVNTGYVATGDVFVPEGTPAAMNIHPIRHEADCISTGSGPSSLGDMSPSPNTWFRNFDQVPQFWTLRKDGLIQFSASRKFIDGEGTQSEKHQTRENKSNIAEIAQQGEWQFK